MRNPVLYYSLGIAAIILSTALPQGNALALSKALAILSFLLAIKFLAEENKISTKSYKK